MQKRTVALVALSLALLIGLSLVSTPAEAQKNAPVKKKTTAAKPAPQKPVDPNTLPREKAQALVTAAKIPAFYNPNKLWLEPIISAPSAILVDADTGQVLWEKNADKRRAMASTTKIMTALLLVERTQPEDIITCTDPSVLKIEESSLHIQPGEKFTAQDLLYGFLLRSGNDAGVVIAQHLAGSVPQFAEMMNARAREMGTTQTNFVNPHGLHHPNHYTTARDLALIAMEAMRNPRFAEAVSQPTRVIQRSKNTKDTLITAKVKPYFYDKFPGADGVKTGYTRAAGRCFVGSATRDERRLMAVVLGATDSASGDTIPILSWGFRRFPVKVVAQKDKVVSAVPVSGGKTRVVDAVAESDFHVTYDLLGKSLPATVESKVISLNTEAPIAVGDIVGKLNVFLGEKQVGAVNLLAAQEVERSPLQATIASLVRWNVPPIGTILIVASVGYLVRYFYVATSSKSNRRRRTRLPTTR